VAMFRTDMDFGKILEQWEEGQKGGSADPGKSSRPHSERRHKAGEGSGVDMGALLKRYPPPAEPHAVSGDRDGGESPPESRYQRLRHSEPQAQLDLHGMTAAEAEEAVDGFLREARARGLDKVLIIHGKGNHSPGQPVLAARVRLWLERSPSAGAFGPAERRHGGGGATWVIVRESEV
jgi:DNA-nicking Smr family endonuclease